MALILLLDRAGVDVEACLFLGSQKNPKYFYFSVHKKIAYVVQR